ncbi:hypothetical protein [Bradyrhizobium uaiense]|uniref:Uncharacterized protein n=1 Tax=Bradyrhizobium uaiense TaxID=2594946 RepID=A0A6P1BXI9_9BRAD|nr:hypothetical protein [Bradyrhizobium uaiense]NEV02894.1 hypothetical protein [Bradyrhizobium uaiense]
MKTAERLFQDFIQAAGLPVGNSVVMRERRPEADAEPSWVIATGNLPDDAKERYEKAVTRLRERHPHVNWGHVKDREGVWRIIRALKTA